MSAQPETAPTAAEQRDLVYAIGVILASSAPVASLAASLAVILSGVGVGLEASRQALALALRTPRSPKVLRSAESRVARRWTKGMEDRRRAAYLLNAALRIQGSIGRGMTPAQAKQKEARFSNAHDDAVRRRADIAERTDRAVDAWGKVLGWYAILDDRTDAECQRLHGKNFRVSRPPLAHGAPCLPGMVHPHCRCMPGPPRIGGGPGSRAVNLRASG